MQGLVAARVLPSGGDRHRPSAPQYLQLDWGALDAGDAQSHATVVDLVVAKILLKVHRRGTHH